MEKINKNYYINVIFDLYFIVYSFSSSLLASKSIYKLMSDLDKLVLLSN